MSASRYDLCTGREDNKGVKRWQKVGVMFPSKEGDGFSIKLEALPLPNDKGEVWVSAFVPRDKDEQPARKAPARSSRRDDDDEIPF